MALTAKHAARVLGLGDDVTLDEVRQVRRDMAKKHHPDHAADTVTATRHMARINAAADTLIAHLKNKPRPSAERGYGAFKAREAAEQAARQARPEPKPAQAKAKTQQRTQQRTQQKTHQRREEKPRAEARQGAKPKAKPSPQRSKTEAALAQFAVKSYASVLDCISTLAPKPTVDTVAPAFARA